MTGSTNKNENGTGNVDTRTLERICKLLKYQNDDIMEYEDET